MNWFDTSGLTSLAKTALKEAQKTIDKALDIQDTEGSQDSASSPDETPTQSPPADFLSSWGLTTSGENEDISTIVDQPITESPSKTHSQSIWGSFAGSFFEPVKPTDEAGYSLADRGVHSAGNVSGESHESELTNVPNKDTKSKVDNVSKSEDKSGLRLNRLSTISFDSGKNSSESVEVLGSQMTTPDSEALSVQSQSQSSSAERKHPSESIEILADSLVSPSIECLGFDSCGTRTECSSTNVSPLDELPEKTTPTDDQETGLTADSVSLVAEDDDDTVSYNSVSECTAPTILDTHGEDKSSVSPNSRYARTLDLHKTRLPDIKDIPSEQSLSGENYASSNDGSWSDRTLNAEDSDVCIEEKKPNLSQREFVEETGTDKLSDSSSFYNVNIVEASGSERSTFVGGTKSQRSSDSGSPKEKKSVSPISSESRSELVKIGSDRTSTHTSGDELETTTSSDIEIIPSPNGDSSLYCRSSPAKYAHKTCKLDGTSPHLVDLVLGKSLSTKIRGHNRELSEASINSNTSDESHNSEYDRLLRRLSEMSEILEAKECRLTELSRHNSELTDVNAQLKSQIDSLRVKHEAGELNMIAEDYAQRMSALEKKFQQAIRDKDILRKQLDTITTESTTRRTNELEMLLKEKDEMIVQLQEEGEKLAKHQFAQSNIIKKLRVKEKENEQVIKSLRDRIAEQTSELDRLKRSISAKEELEVSQIEAVYKLTNANKKLDAELEETKSLLDDTQQKLTTTKKSLEAARKELQELQKSSSDLKRRRDALADIERDKQQSDAEVDRLSAVIDSLRAKIGQDEARWVARDEAQRRELAEARAAGAAMEARAADAAGGAGGALLSQLAALQQAAMEREHAHRAALDKINRAKAEAERAALQAAERERAAREELAGAAAQAGGAERGRAEAERGRAELADTCERLAARLASVEAALASSRQEFEHEKSSASARETELSRRLGEMEKQLKEEKERRRSTTIQEQAVSVRAAAGGDISPSQSFTSETLSASLWTQDEGSEGYQYGSVHCLEEVLSRLQRREGELRALGAAAASTHSQLRAAQAQLAQASEAVDKMQSLQEQYDTLLQMYGEKEEQSQELRLDLQDVTKLYKSQLDEIIALRKQVAAVQQ